VAGRHDIRNDIRTSAVVMHAVIPQTGPKTRDFISRRSGERFSNSRSSRYQRKWRFRWILASRTKTGAVMSCGERELESGDSPRGRLSASHEVALRKGAAAWVFSVAPRVRERLVARNWRRERDSNSRYARSFHRSEVPPAFRVACPSGHPWRDVLSSAGKCDESASEPRLLRPVGRHA